MVHDNTLLKCDKQDTIAPQFLGIPLDNESHNEGSIDHVYSPKLRDVNWSWLLLRKKIKNPNKIGILLTNIQNYIILTKIWKKKITWLLPCYKLEKKYCIGYPKKKKKKIALLWFLSKN